MEIIINPVILSAFGLSYSDCSFEKFGSGHINYTIRIYHRKDGKYYVLQRINTQVFKDPETIARNHRLASDYLSKKFPDYFFLSPIKTTDGQEMVEINGDFWRMIPFVEHSIALDQADNPKQAYEAAKQFGRMAKNLSGIDLHYFKPTIPDFHNLTLRYSSFQGAILHAREERREYAEELIESFQQYSFIPISFESLKTDPDFRDRLMHHDTKINNVLLDDRTFEGICVIDLDTLMPGKMISDLGDMIRTYVSPCSEEEQEFGKIYIREEYYEALMKGYLSELGGDLTKTEQEVLFFSGQFIIYMQGIRFLTDFLDGNIYYPTRYPEQNYIRAKNQLTLLERLNEKEKVLRNIIRNCLEG
ncbi:MAG: phosphotransferase enzyme family protein [Chitinophagaceae bacterium]